jgi:hypothetical protein
MKYYIGSSDWLYMQLQKHYYEVNQSYKGIISETEFKDKVESGKVFNFTYRVYTLSFDNVLN